MYIYFILEMLVNPYDVSNEYQVAKASRSTDMYAFALVAYELLTEEKPFADVHKETLLAVKVHQGMFNMYMIINIFLLQYNTIQCNYKMLTY